MAQDRIMPSDAYLLPVGPLSTRGYPARATGGGDYDDLLRGEPVDVCLHALSCLKFRFLKGPLLARSQW